MIFQDNRRYPETRIREREVGKTVRQRKNFRTEGEWDKGNLGRDWKKQNVSAWERFP